METTYASGFEGAGSGRRLANWGLYSGGPNAALLNSFSSLRSRQRELVRNNPLAGGGVDSIVSNMIGKGITPRWQLKDPELKEQVQIDYQSGF
jgi:capsid protein